jgi:uncharacterized protein
MAKIRQGLTVVVAAVALSMLATAAMAAGREAVNTAADYTPGRSFEPLAASAACAPATDAPFELPAGYDQEVVAEEGEGGTIDLGDMNTQNEFGKDAGRYVYRTHETGTGGQVSVSDLQTGQTRVLAQRADLGALRRHRLDALGDHPGRRGGHHRGGPRPGGSRGDRGAGIRVLH